MNSYSEETLIEEPAIALLAEMGWETLDCRGEFGQAGGSPLGRKTQSEVVLTTRLRIALERLNPHASEEAIEKAISELTRSRAVMNLVEANRDIYAMLKDGVKVTVSDASGEDETVEDVRVIDWDDAANNDFFAASQLQITGQMYSRRPDLVGFVNGVPLVLMEFKRIDKPVYAAYYDNLRDYKDTIPSLFWYNAFIILSNGTESKVGSLTANWEHFAEWKRVHDEKESTSVSLETLLCGLCTPQRLLDIVENFIVFMEAQGGLIKILAKNHQYLGVNNAVASLKQVEEERLSQRLHRGRLTLQENHGKLGVFWHTQGSGKSLSMLFFAQKVLRKVPGKWAFVVVTDREALDSQIYKTFASSSGVLAPQTVHAQSVAHLRQLLQEGHRYIFTLIHKFQTQRGEKHPILSAREDIITIADEAHRTQYDTLALNMRTALPNAVFIAFTGTPLMEGEEKTKAVFGDYVSIYDFKQSIADGATVPLYYENRVPELQLTNEALNEDLGRILTEAELDEAQETRIESEFARAYHLITRNERLEKIAADIVAHFMGRGHRGKAMVISIDKATAVKMFDKVQRHWKNHLAHLKSIQKPSLPETAADEEQKTLQTDIRYMEETDMAVVVSPSQNEVADLREKGADITLHRKRMHTEDLATKFKDAEDRLRIVFVCAMWITGFDVPSCSTIYLDKPQRNHTLMQTIARANRVCGDKENGLIVDYIGVFRALEKALAIYAAADKGGTMPVADKAELVEQLKQAVAELSTFCMDIGVVLDTNGTREPLERLELIADAVNRILINDETKRNYLQLAGNVTKLYQAILPDTAANLYGDMYELSRVIARKIRNLDEPVDISVVMTEVEAVLDKSIAPEESPILESLSSYDWEKPIDVSQIDFDAFRAQFERHHKRIGAAQLRSAINRKLVAMLRLNKNRLNYQAKFEQLIAEYNQATINVDGFIEQLIALASELNAEEKRAHAEQLNEDELALFDMLTQPDNMRLTQADRRHVKVVVRKLLTSLKSDKLVLDWRKQENRRAAVQLTVDEILDELPKCYSQEVYHRKCAVVYQHIYESYYGAGKSIYTE